MSDVYRKLPTHAWRRIYRVTFTLTAISVTLSMIFTNMFMEIFSAGINVQGLMVSIVMPVGLGGPLTFVLMLRHAQLRQANAQLEHLATTDWLTDCLNRGAFTGAVTRHLERGAPVGRDGGALLIVDADDFKSVNDRFGHFHGDEALRQISAAIRLAVRSTDLVGRLGGEEFGVLLIGADMILADHVAERIRRYVSDIAFSPDGIPHALSVSIGGTIYDGRAQFGDLYRRADHHLYQAKNTGRDRVAMTQAA